MEPPGGDATPPTERRGAIRIAFVLTEFVVGGA